MKLKSQGTPIKISTVGKCIVNQRSIWAMLTAISLLCANPIIAKSQDTPTYELNYKDVSIEQFIKTAGLTLNKRFILGANVQGTLSTQVHDIQGDQEYFRIFETILNLHGYSLVLERNVPNTYTVLAHKDAKQSASPVIDQAQQLQNGMVTLVIPLRHVQAARLAPIARQVTGTTGNSIVLHVSNPEAIIARTDANKAQMLEHLVKKLDAAGDSFQEVSIARLEYASATDAVRMLNEWLRQTSYNSGSTSKNGTQLIADERLNAIWVFGPSRNKILEQIKKLDQKAETQGNTRVFYLKHAKAEKLVPILQSTGNSIESEMEVTKGKKTAGKSNQKSTLNVQHEATSNALIVTAPLSVMRQIEEVIVKLDIRSPQVLVEAIIVELQDAKGDALGVDWYGRKKGVFAGSIAQNDSLPSGPSVASAIQSIVDNDGIKEGNLSIVSDGLAGVNGPLAGFFSGDWGALVKALNNNTDNEILSTPSVVTTNNKEAVILVGQDVGIPTGQRTDSGSSTSLFNEVKRQEVGTKLKITPQINAGDVVELEIEQEVSSVTSSATSSQFGPSFDKRNIKSTASVKSGEAVILGGLVSEELKEQINRMPLLGYIPFLGDLLFSTKSVSKSNRKLMVFIRPTIIPSDDWHMSLSQRQYQEMQTTIDHARKPGGLFFRSYDKIKLPPLNPGSLTEIKQAASIENQAAGAQKSSNTPAPSTTKTAVPAQAEGVQE